MSALSGNHLFKPTSSEKSSSSSSKLTESTEAAYLNDPKFRQYAAAVEKALKSFEYTSEWADLISALGKLNKLIQTHSKYACIPKSVTVSKRLSQCMHPALPFGVHLKALECYKQIFDALGTVNIGRDLCMYSIGLFPLYANATINVRRSLLELYEKYFVALGSLLKPALIGFLNGLLPGLEEGSEFCERLIDLLNQIHAGVGSLYFYSCLWECVYCTPGVRLPALLYACNQLDRKRSVDDQLHIVGASIDRMVDALCAAGGDSNVLVQRQLLDFVNIAFPLNSHNLLRSDMIRLVENCIFVVLKRDMSLNRRLYSWLLGAKNEIEYFENITKPLVVEAVLHLIEKKEATATSTTNEATKDLRTKLLRLLLYMLDRPDVGRPLVLQLLSPLLVDLVSTRKADGDDCGDEANASFENSLKVLGLLMDALKPGFIWEYLNEKIRPLVNDCLSNGSENLTAASTRLNGYLDVVDLFLGNKDLLSHSDNNGHHTSEFLVHLLEHISECRSNYSKCEPEQLSLARRYLETVMRLLNAVQRISPPIDLSSLVEKLEKGEIKKTDEQQSKSTTNSIIDSQLCFETCRRSAATIVSSVADLFLERTPSEEAIQLLSTLASLLKLLADLPIYSILDQSDKRSHSSSTWTNDLGRLCLAGHFEAQRQAAELLLHMYALWKSIVEQRRLVMESFHSRRTTEKPTIFLKSMLPEGCVLAPAFFKNLAQSLWDRLDSSTPEYYDEACRLFLLLHSVVWEPGQDGYGDSVCVELVLEKMKNGEEIAQSEAARRFCIVWSLGRRYLANSFLPGYPCRPLIRPALLMLDNLQSDATLGQLAHRWYEDCLDRGDLSTLLHAFCTSLAQPSTARLSVQSIKVFPITGPDSDEERIVAYRLDSYSKGALYHRLDGHVKNLPDVTMLEPSSETVVEGLVYEIVEAVANEFQDEDILEIDPTSASSYETSGQEGVVEDYEGTEERRSASSACSASAVSMPSPAGGGGVDEEPISATIEPQISIAEEQPPPTVDRQSSTASRSPHAHTLFYRQRFNLDCAIHAFRLLGRMITYSPRRFVETLLSTGPPICEISGELSYLLSCHQKSISGFEFSDGDDMEKNVGTRSPISTCMYFESLFTLSLYFIRSCFVDDPAQKLTIKDVQNNWFLKTAAVQFLANTVRVIGDICDDGGRSVSAYVADVLSRCKLQKCVLHCLMAHVGGGNDEESNSEVRNHFIEAVVKFNSSFPNSSYALLSYESDLLKLLEAIVHVEYRIRNARADFSTSGIILDKLSVNAQVSPAHAARQATPMASQKLFLFVILNALKHAPYVSHDSWLRFIVRCLPFMEKTLPSVLLHACEQLCKNLEVASELYVDGAHATTTDGRQATMPVNYVTNVLDKMTILCHFALLDSTAGCLPSSTQLGTSTTIDIGLLAPGAIGVGGKAAAGEVFGNLARVFAFGDGNMAQTASNSNKEGAEKKTSGYLQAARQELLAALPHMLSTLCGLWASIKANKEPLVPVGPPQRVRRVILEMLSPIAVNQTRHFLSALALVWLTRSNDKALMDKAYTASQADLVDLLLSIKTLPFEKLVAGVLKTLKEPVRAKNTEEKDAFPLEISLLEMVAGIQSETSVGVIKSSWTPLQQLIVDGLQTVTLPPAKFLLFKLFHSYVARVQSIDDKTSRKEAQDACQKLVDSVNDIVAWHLEQPTWLKRSLVVKQDPDGPDPIDNANGLTNVKHTALWSAKALNLFAEHLATMLDILYKNEEKDRMITLLTAVWTNVLPYLKTRVWACRRHFSFASKFLARLSQYSQTRPVWRKQTIDLVVEPNFFSCGDVSTLKQWSIIVDNLMTQDKTSFKEFMAKTAISQSAGIFTSREQEYDSRGAALKRLAFVLLSSDVDQYQPYLADVQERLTENLRLYQVPHVCADVFLCFRVLLIRLTPNQLLPLWPTMITETMQVLLLIEQELRGNNGNDDYKCARDDQWLLLFVAAAKFLDALCRLPPSKLPQFQMYEWVFTSSLLCDDGSSVTDQYVPQIERVKHLMDEKYGPVKGGLNGTPFSLAGLKQANNLKDLQLFFVSLCDSERLHRQVVADPHEVQLELEEALYRDLLAAM